MSCAGLIEMPPVSKVMPFPTRTRGFCFLPAPLYSRTMNLGGCSLPLVTDRNELLRQGLRPLGEIGRSANVGGKITEIAREIHAVCDRQSPRRGRFARSEVAALWHGEGELAQRPADLRGLALHLVETVDRFHRHDNCVFDAPRDFSPFDLLFGEIDHRLVGAGFVEQLYRGAHCGTKLALAEVSL